MSVELLNVTPLLNFLLLSYQWVFKRFLFSFFSHQFLRFDVSLCYLCLRLGVENLGDRFWHHWGFLIGFQMLSARGGRTDITNVSMWKRLILIQGRKHVRAKKKGSGRWKRDRNTAGCHSGTWTKILNRVTRQGEGQQRPLGKKNLQICCLCNCLSYFQWLLSPKLEALRWFQIPYFKINK